MKNKQEFTFDTWQTTPDYYEAAYQKYIGEFYQSTVVFAQANYAE